MENSNDNNDKNSYGISGQGDMSDEHQFEYRLFKDNRIQIFWKSKRVMMLKGSAAQDLMKKLERSEGREEQLVLAKVTGNFKRGNEKALKKKK